MRALAFCLIAQTASAGVLFEDVSANLPAHSYTGGWEHFVGGGVAVFDCNGDSLPDIFAAGGDSPATLMINRGEMQFDSAVLPNMTSATGAYPLDVDGDGHLDVMVLRVGENQLLRGDGACGFTAENDALGFDGGEAWSTAFSATWEPAGPVLAIGNYVDREDPEGPFEACDDNTLHRWTGAGFAVTRLSPGYCALSVLFARDASGQKRLRISNDRHYYVHAGSEQLYDLGLARFLGPDDGWETIRLWGMGIASRDITGDGRAEVMLTSMGDQLMQIAGEDGHYTRAPYGLGTYAQRPHLGDDGRPSTGWHAEFADVNNDARPDLFIAKGNVDQMPGLAMEDPNTLLIQQADGTFTERSVEAGVATLDRSRGAALADLDGDGRLDLVVMNRRAPMELYRNVTEGTGHWLAVDLRMPGANTRAIGALVELSAGGITQTQEVTVGGGHAGGQAGPLHFGLADADTAQLRITWPDGVVTEHKTDQTDRIITLTP
ncbi:CRTAC1 family protein [Roseobacter sp. YSTF-M11]|uniref:CRTAC1 family protein n=1 Tax=Roseobacter insulae TaxID=2859783 RepID=A0A9X1K0D4_9RHOB|nr:CRTAC1 family protein [Roseobacter insulae]MBW4710130.1 CRTAC1 family protein [Roseobacter insulae]